MGDQSRGGSWSASPTVPWETARVSAEPSYVSPGGTAEIRLLPSFEQGEIVHARALPGRPSDPGTVVGTGELFYVLSGEGKLWRRSGDVQDVTSLAPQRFVSIPPGIEYQFRASGGALEFLVATAPRWRREDWSEAQGRWWNDGGDVVGSGPCRPGPWLTGDLSPNYDYLAPDGSEIRLLPTFDAGGLAHCRLPEGRVSAAVRHRTVVEIWYVLSGRGQVWRAKGDDEETVDVGAGTALTLPVGTSFQFRAAKDEPLDIMIGTFPRWPGPTEAEPVDACWATPEP